MICKLCAWAADTYGDAQWLKAGRTLPYPYCYADTAAMFSAVIEAHAECALRGGCDCQHWLPGSEARIRPASILHTPPRCSVCYRRGSTTPKGGKIWRHKLNHLMKWNRRGPICPGSGMDPLVKDTAVTAIPSWALGDESSSSTPDTGHDGQAEQ